MASSVNGHDGKYQRAAHGQPRHSALTDGDGAAAYALPWSDDELRAFDYTALDAETRIVVQQRTGEIKSLMRRTAQDIIEIGLKLTEVKARLGHGSFGGWLKAEFEWSERTAQNFMRVADAFKSATVADLIAPKALYLLAAPSTPDAAREEALERAAAGAAVTFSDAKAITAKHKTALERFPEPLRPAIIQIAEAQAGSLNVPLTPRLVERTGAVITEAATTGCVDTGDGLSTPLAAALTLEQAEAFKRQAEYIHEKTARRLALEERRQEKARTAQSLPSGIYNVIYADPPWQYDNTGVDAAANAHYHTLPLADICDFLKTINLQVAQNAVLFLWSTNPFLADALRVVEAWNFTYKTNLVWVKTDLSRPGTGFYVRGQHELLFICTRGSFTPLNWSQNVPSVLAAPVRQHSRKPDEIYGVIENLYPNCRYIELFARQQRDGWTAYGNELN